MGDAYTRHAHFVERYKTGQFNKVKPYILKIHTRLRDELLRTATVQGRKRTQAKLKAVERIIFTIFTEYTDELKEQFDLFMMSEAKFGQRAINKYANDFDAVIPALSRLRTAAYSRPFNNRLLKQTLRDFPRQQARMIRDAVSMGFFEGKTTPQIIGEIIGTSANNFNDGLLKVSRNSASRMTRTAINHLAATAKEQLFKENGINKYEWVATLDSRTSDICTSLDGDIFEVGKGRLPPAHHNCRSTTAPIL